MVCENDGFDIRVQECQPIGFRSYNGPILHRLANRIPHSLAMACYATLLESKRGAQGLFRAPDDRGGIAIATPRLGIHSR